MSSLPPMQIMMLIEIHCFVYEDQVSTFNGSPASEKFLSRLLRDELIEFSAASAAPREYRVRHPFNTTRRGQALLEKLCSTPLPVLEEKWV